MPRYDYRCRECGETFEVSRSMTDNPAQTPCPSGHVDTVKLLSTFATVSRGSAPAPVSTPAPTGGGCCGGGCCG
ncbi:zinc ribbon domain-containing protein [Skermania sp. ID1734]|nr:zinc ribbon domain-containing protein [Skermania sp. ID1734]TSD93955.1 zinc ribbon domain-containing protein [Skermania sp. ID1734]